MLLFGASIINQNSTKYHPLTAPASTGSAVDSSDASQHAVEFATRIPNDGTLSNLEAIVNGTLQSGASIELTVFKNGAATDLKITLDASGSVAKNNSDAVLVAAGDLVALRTVSSGPYNFSPQQNVSYSVELD